MNKRVYSSEEKESLLYPMQMRYYSQHFTTLQQLEAFISGKCRSRIE